MFVANPGDKIIYYPDSGSLDSKIDAYRQMVAGGFKYWSVSFFPGAIHSYTLNMTQEYSISGHEVYQPVYVLKREIEKCIKQSIDSANQTLKKYENFIL